MSAVLRLPCDGKPNNIYFIYDFKEVDDSILMVMYVDKFNAWKKIFINYEDGAWNTDLLVYYTDNKTYRQICSKLKFIFLKRGSLRGHKALRFNETMQKEAAFMLDACS